MSLQPYSELVLWRDVPEEGLYAGVVGVVVERMTSQEVKRLIVSISSICSATPWPLALY